MNDDQDDQRGDEAAEAEALHAPHDRIEQIAERDAGGERRDRAAEQVEETAERRQRDGPYEDLAFEGHGAAVAWRVGRLQQVPAAAPGIGEDGDDSVSLAPRRFEKAHAARAHRRMIAREVVGLEKIGDAPARRRADRLALARVGGLGEHKPRAAAARRRDDDPALVRAERRVFDQVEAERVAKPGDRVVIIGDEEGDGGEASGSRGGAQRLM